MEKILNTIRPYIPRRIFSFFQPAYHYILALCAALWYGFPSRKIKVVGVTGTKGKSTTTEIISTILEAAGYTTALSNTIRYKIGNESFSNMFKMSMPGRFFVQKLMREAVKQKCDYFVLEMTSQGVLHYRHMFIDLDALVFTNLSPEHIEAHGSYENYRDAKLQIARSLEKSSKRPRIIVANADDREHEKFLTINADIKKTFSLKDGVLAHTLPGEFNSYNVLAAATVTEALGIDRNTIQKAIAGIHTMPGRVEFIRAGQDFDVIVDYAHTPDSLEKLYKAFSNRKKICVLGGTGGGRDGWKRKEMGAIADRECSEIILTDEDPYDEDPVQIVRDVAAGITTKTPVTIMDRREAIAVALRKAGAGDIVLITGKGTDPYIMGPRGTKTPWSDAQVAREELAKLLRA